MKDRLATVAPPTVKMTGRTLNMVSIGHISVMKRSLLGGDVRGSSSGKHFDDVLLWVEV